MYLKGTWIECSTSHKLYTATFLILYYYHSGVRDSVIGIATGYELDDRGTGVRAPVRSRIFSPLSSPDVFWVPPDLLSNGYRGFFLGGKAAGA
jgi:hypothetical protein